MRGPAQPLQAAAPHRAHTADFARPRLALTSAYVLGGSLTGVDHITRQPRGSSKKAALIAAPRSAASSSASIIAVPEWHQLVFRRQFHAAREERAARRTPKAFMLCRGGQPAGQRGWLARSCPDLLDEQQPNRLIDIAAPSRPNWWRTRYANQRAIPLDYLVPRVLVAGGGPGDQCHYHRVVTHDPFSLLRLTILAWLIPSSPPNGVSSPVDPLLLAESEGPGSDALLSA